MLASITAARTSSRTETAFVQQGEATRMDAEEEMAAGAGSHHRVKPPTQPAAPRAKGTPRVDQGRW